MAWLVPFSELTETQRRAVQLAPDRRRVFSGPPGSGKSMVLLHRAAYLRDCYRIREDRMAIFVFTRALCRYLREAAPLLHLDPKRVQTFDSWCWHQAQARGIRVRAGREPDFAALRQRLWQCLDGEINSRLFDAVLVDEGQDLDRAAYGILMAMASHITVCVDPNQQIYQQGTSDADIAKLLGLNPSRISFLDAFRCSPLVSQLASFYLAPGFSREAFLRQVRQVQGEREMPVLFVAGSHAAEHQRLFAVAKTRLAKGERVGILIPSNSFKERLKREAT